MSKKILSGGITLAEYARRVFRATPDYGTSKEDVLAPDYWAHVAPQLRPGDRVEIQPEGGAWFMDALVVGQSNLHAKLAVLNYVQLSDPSKVKDPKGEQGPLVAEWKGPQRKWTVIRTADKVFVKEGLASREEADTWIADNGGDLL